MVITVQGQGHPHTEDTVHAQGLQYLENSLPLNGLYLKGKKKGSILADTEKFHLNSFMFLIHLHIISIKNF